VIKCALPPSLTNAIVPFIEFIKGFQVKFKEGDSSLSLYLLFFPIMGFFLMFTLLFMPIAASKLFEFILIIFGPVTVLVIYLKNQEEENLNLRDIYIKNKKKIAGILIIVAFIYFIIVPTYLADINADKLINGDSARFELEINTKNVSLTNTTFILILQNNGNYYLIEKSALGNKSAKLYVIPEKEINMIIMKRYQGRGVPLKENEDLFNKFQIILNNTLKLWPSPKNLLVQFIP